MREQLSSLQEATAAVVKDSRSNDAQLSETYGALGEIYHAYSLNAPARECYVNANRLAPNDFRWVYLLAKLDQQEGLVDEAIKEYRIAGALQPDYLAVEVNLGNIYLELNRLEDARTSFAAALKVQESIPAAHYGLGQIALSQRDFVEALAHYKKALELAPWANRIHYSMAMAYRGLKDQENVRLHLAQQGTVGVRVADPLVDRFPELIKGERVHMILGRRAIEAKRYEESAAEFRKAVAANPNSVPALVNLGAALTQTGNLKGAAEQFEKALQIDPNNVNAHYNLAVLLLNDNQQAAIVHLQAVSRINPNDFGARFLLARELSRSGRVDEALDQFTLIVQGDPNNEEALVEQVKLLQQQKRYRDALAVLEKGHSRYPEKGQTAAMLAQMLAASPQYDLRDGARALKLAQLVYEAKGSLEHGALVAMALAESGRCSEAAHWQRKMIAVAEQQGLGTKELAILKADLAQYEKATPCRPTSESP
ncbi:MAG TPA: tetratricopeptide repeat protein [Pyrinomonadaceae bacterium]|nr:tetratricopeptide repeat protein [Pyrinomonadaceae bacterium]